MRSFSQFAFLLHHDPTLQALAKCRIFTCDRSISRFKQQFYQPHPKKKPFFTFWQAFCNIWLSPEPLEGADNVELTRSKPVLR